jgi:ATP-dependent RNA helicase DeaD
MDMHGRGHLPYDRVKVAILDEVDRMLDIGFRDDIRRILGTMKHPHQTLFVSATISPEIEKLAHQYLRNPERLVLTASKSLTVSQVNQSYISVQRWDKNRLLVHLLTHEDPALTLVFCRMKQTVDALTEYLTRHKIDAHAIHGDMYQGKRNRIMDKFRAGDLSVLVASDLAARGLDVDNITHVINYDLPEDPEIYVHRIGRTARAGKNGIAWSFVTPDQGDLLTAIEMLTNVEVPRKDFPDFTPGPVPADVAAQRERDAQRREAVRTEQNRLVTPPPALVGDHDAAKFPGGLVPSALPAKRLGGKLRTRRR